MLIRLDKFLSERGILTRSESKKEIKSGTIKVNGVPAKSSDVKIDTDKDEISFKGEVISGAQFVYYLLNKPAGVVSATEDNLHKTVIDLIEDTRPDLFPVGRLDIDTTGLLIITNDGDLGHKLTSPKKEVKKLYEARLDKEISEKEIEALKVGVDIGEEKPAVAREASFVDSNDVVRLVLTEGKFHEVKRMFKAVGAEVVALKRLAMGSLSLDESLEEGSYRELTKEEIENLKKL